MCVCKTRTSKALREAQVLGVSFMWTQKLRDMPPDQNVLPMLRNVTASCGRKLSWARRSPGPCSAAARCDSRSVCCACLPDVPAWDVPLDRHTCPWCPRVPCAQTSFGKRCLGETPVTPNTNLYRVVVRPVLPSSCLKASATQSDSERPASVVSA